MFTKSVEMHQNVINSRPWDKQWDMWGRHWGCARPPVGGRGVLSDVLKVQGGTLGDQEVENIKYFKSSPKFIECMETCPNVL